MKDERERRECVRRPHSEGIPRGIPQARGNNDGVGKTCDGRGGGGDDRRVMNAAAGEGTGGGGGGTARSSESGWCITDEGGAEGVVVEIVSARSASCAITADRQKMWIHGESAYNVAIFNNQETLLMVSLSYQII